jgi:D-amino-acid oxidase
MARRDEGDPRWARRLPGFALCPPEERAGFPIAFWMRLPIVDMPIYLDYLVGRLAAAGVAVETTATLSLPDAAALAPVVVDCTGVGAGRFAGDGQVFPVRGQHVVVDNPGGLADFFFEQNPGPVFTSYFVHGRRVIIGGTNDRGSWNLRADPAQTELLLRRCAAVEPRLAAARVLGVEVGLRAARARIRLDEQWFGDTRVIHNYGHGGVAVGMSWGCAREVHQMIVRQPVAGRRFP